MAKSIEKGKLNPDYGKLRVVDCFIIIYSVFRVLLLELPVFLLTYSFVYAHTRSTSFSANLQHFLIRRTNCLLNPASIRFSTRSSSQHVTAILASPRYSHYQENINRPVARPAFKGSWVLQHSFKNPKAPSSSDLTIFYLHGGGYFSSQPAHYLLFLLRLAESILENDVSVSVFTLDYSLAPEHVFPTQLDEAAAAYAFLTTEEQIPAEKIVLAGDSAGGHLALSLLVHLCKQRSPTVENRALETPGGLALMSPWLSLHHEPISYTLNEHKDILSGPFVRRCARHFLGHAPTAHETIKSPYLEFLTPEPAVEWDPVIPSWAWASAGGNEIFFDNVKTWVEKVNNAFEDRRVIFEVGVGKVHDWQWLETIMDEQMKKAFLGRTLGDGGGFEATASIGKTIVRNISGGRTTSGLH